MLDCWRRSDTTTTCCTDGRYELLSLTTLLMLVACFVDITNPLDLDLQPTPLGSDNKARWLTGIGTSQGRGRPQQFLFCTMDAAVTSR